MAQKITVTSLGEAWRNHARMIPVDITPLGTLTRDGRPHAFGRDPEGEYWIFGDGRPERLPAIRIQKGIAAVLTKLDPI